MTIIVTEQTERPLIDEPMVMDCKAGKNPSLRITEFKNRFSNQVIGEEYCMRVLGPGEYDVIFDGEYFHV